jgi:hypothetical protein
MPSDSGPTSLANLLDALVDDIKQEPVELTLSHYAPTRLEIKFEEGYIIIHQDGKVELSKDLAIDEAARTFWERISFWGSENSTEEWKEQVRKAKEDIACKNGIIKALMEKLKETEEKLKRLEFKEKSENVDRFDLED